MSIQFKEISMNLNRRQFITTAAGLAAAICGQQAFAKAEDVEAAIKAIAGDAEVGTGGGLKLNTPEIAENGNSVPVSVTVDSPMTEDSYVESVALFADGNPRPEVVSFNFTPASGEAFAATRMRLAKTQNIVAVAKMSDGSIVSETRNVKVTIGGCGG